jgi:NAD(P)-dependent dehydrogenase (short-subunit alcohol dehydrogenase family)
LSIFKEHLLGGKTAFLTGGGSGINLAIAERYAEHGAKVVLVGRNLEKTRAAARAIEDRGGCALGLSADVRDYAALETAFETAVEAYGPIDLLVCGAAGNFPAPANGMSANAFKSVIDIDLLGTFNACRAAFQHLRRPGASVLMISAIQSLQPMSWQTHVCAAKAGVDMLMKSLALEWGSEGVRLNSIAPGPVSDTEGLRRLGQQSEDRLKHQLPLQRFAEKGEIADLALFLSSEAARNVTGAVIPTDGGCSVLGAGRMIEATARAAGKA